MAKARTNLKRRRTGSAKPSRPAGVRLRRLGRKEEQRQPPAREAAPSPLLRLVDEVERLRIELAAARAQVTALEARADTDPLLDIFNRRGFERELRRSLAYIKRYGVRAALIYLDLDGFKPINDSYGHAAGDAVLKAVTATLTRNIRASDVVARLGGDEFAVLLWNVAEEDAAAKAAALERAVAATEIPWGVQTLSVAASAGCTILYPLDEPAPALTRADQAMYGRKAQRKFFKALPVAENARLPVAEPQKSGRGAKRRPKAIGKARKTVRR
jgi:diguanylate cyclase (GGDEF)-like protein